MKEFVCDYLSKEVTVNGRKLNVSLKIVQVDGKLSLFNHNIHGTNFILFSSGNN